MIRKLEEMSKKSKTLNASDGNGGSVPIPIRDVQNRLIALQSITPEEQKKRIPEAFGVKLKPSAVAARSTDVTETNNIVDELDLIFNETTSTDSPDDSGEETEDDEDFRSGPQLQEPGGR